MNTRRRRATGEYRTPETVVVLALALAWAVGPVAALRAQDARPIAVFAQPIHDFGEVEAGVPLRHVFRIGNRGQAPLEVHRVDSTCACTVAGFDPTIAAGAVGEIQVDLLTDGQEGPFAVHLHAYTNDPETPDMTLTLKADLKVGLRAWPGYVRFVQTAGFREPVVDAQIVAARDQRLFSIRSVELPFPYLEASFREAADDERREDAGRSQWRVEIRLLPTAPEGPLTGFVEVHTDHPRQAIVVLPLNGFVRPPFEVHPGAADLGSFEAGSERRTSVRIRSRIETAADAIVRVETDVAGLETEIVRDTRDDALFFVVVHAARGIAAGEIDGTLRIHTLSDVQPLIELPIRGSARGS